jgi:hypothetical protein
VTEEKTLVEARTVDRQIVVAGIGGLVLGTVLGLTANGFQHATGIPFPPVGSTGPTTSTLSALKDAAAIIQSVATVGGIGAAAYLFFWRRRPYPRLVFSQDIQHHHLTDETVWLRVQVSIENKGDGLARLGARTTKIRQILPLDSRCVPYVVPLDSTLHYGDPHLTWTTLTESVTSRGEVEIEPSEITTYEVDFLLPNTLQLIQVYTFVENPMKVPTGYGWPIDTIYLLGESDQPSTPESINDNEEGLGSRPERQRALERADDNQARSCTGSHPSKPDQARSDAAAGKLHGEERLAMAEKVPEKPAKPQQPFDRSGFEKAQDLKKQDRTPPTPGPAPLPDVKD